MGEGGGRALRLLGGVLDFPYHVHKEALVSAHSFIHPFAKCIHSVALQQSLTLTVANNLTQAHVQSYFCHSGWVGAGWGREDANCKTQSIKFSVQEEFLCPHP